MNSWARLSFRRVLLICFFCIAAVIAATIPLVEMPINDDFSYTRVALSAAQTGRLIYSGWGSPIVGIQAYWAALFIKLFGFSFQIVRLSAIPFTFGCAAILLSLFKRAGLGPVTALFAVLTLMLSPVVIPLEPTFMTDITSLFFVLLTIWCAERVVHSSSDAEWLRWMFATATAGIAGTTIRQSVALALVATLPFLAWHASRRGHAAIAMLVLVLSVGCVVALNVWYQAQPYGVPLPLIDKANFKGYKLAFYNTIANIIQVPLLVLPAMFLTISGWRKFSIAARFAFLAFGVGAAGFLWYVWRSRPYLPKIPFGHLGGSMVTQWGLLGLNVEMLGEKPLILRTRMQVAILAVTFSLSVAAASWIVKAIRLPRSVGALKAFTLENAGFVLLSLYACAYIPLIALRLYVADSFDRYLIPILPAVVLGICMLPGTRVRAPGVAAWMVLGAGTFLGAGLAHDYFSQSRGRLAAAESLHKAGIPRTMISAGVEYDLWTQLENARYINDPMISNPPNAYVPVDLSSSPVQPPIWFWNYAPALKPKYILVLSPQRGLADSGYATIPFSRWLSPDGRVLIQTGPATLGR